MLKIMTPPTGSEERRGTLLVVDDEPEILTALQDLFEEDFHVHAAHSGAEGLEILRRTPEVEVIISDQRMPGMTGDVFLARAREMSQAEALLLTGYAELDAVISAVNRGRIAFYAPKPWDPGSLRSMVLSALERRRLTRALETERALLRGLLDASADPLSFKDTEGRFIRLNAAKAQSLGGRVEDLLGRRETDLLPSEQAAALAGAEREVMRSGRGTDRVGQLSGDGGTRWMRVQRLPILDRDGRPTHLATIEHDLTEQRMLEERLRQAEKMQALGTMAGGVAHDFNNLLTAILGSLDLVLQSGTNQGRQEMLLKTAITAAERGSALTRRLLSFSRKRELQLRPTDVNRLVQEMDGLLSRSLGEQVEVVRLLAPDLWPALVDQEQFALGLLNLCINSRDAMPEGGVVTLSTRNASVGEDEVPDLHAGDYAVLAVADTGQGMSPDIMVKAFEPFFTTKEVGKGTGLGLSMVYGLARQSGGTVTLASQPGHGTVVEVYLPRSEWPAASRQQQEGQAPACQSCRVLVVDDDASVRGITTTFLNELGHQTLEAADGASALALLEGDEAVDLLVTDFAMPGMSGDDLAARARVRRPGLPVLLLTGYADPANRSSPYPVLRKPFRQTELARQVAAVLRGA
ncbi:response regulator [Roseomonas marmotae]|uniref:histidine kinase n=1 Tax=Roseomonas marmotae TaxID=2768161 RepID=A0ABS3K9Q5_9PROT|nr:response regulator [Roseomonas marmotae]MBO1074199.1 response regulator [Roseomonas marmotae]QTI81017.1 response regulator [Roseomonas marmotae]